MLRVEPIGKRWLSGEVGCFLGRVAHPLMFDVAGVVVGEGQSCIVARHILFIDSEWQVYASTHKPPELNKVATQVELSPFNSPSKQYISVINDYLTNPWTLMALEAISV